MAFTNKNLSALGYGSGITMWVYSTADTAATCAASGYFNSMIDVMRVGDLIYIYSGVGGTNAFGLFAVRLNDGTNVDLTDVTALVVTNAG